MAKGENMKHKTLLILLMIIILPALCGCNDNSDFQSAYGSFVDSYYKATDFYDLDDERLEALKMIDTDSINVELKNMKSALDILNNVKETEQEKEAYESLKSDYDDLLYLVSVYDKFDSLSEDEKVDVENKLVGIFINRTSIERRKD